MDSNEFRIGNLLMDESTGALLLVDALARDNVTTYVINRNLYPLPKGWRSVEVLLTNEWLMRFGFVYPNFSPEFDTNYNNDYDFETVNLNGFLLFKKDNFLIGFKNDRFFIVYENAGYDEQAHIYSFGISFKFVHHLQNLYFALTGEELIYNLIA